LGLKHWNDKDEPTSIQNIMMELAIADEKVHPSMKKIKEFYKWADVHSLMQRARNKMKVSILCLS